MKVDITTGDIITPEVIRYAFHSNFENKNIEVWAYNIETILAEKLETILRRSVLNTRPRDFYDVYVIMKTRQYDVDNNTLILALLATSEKRNSLTALKDHDKILTTIKTDPAMKQRWDRYCEENFMQMVSVLTR